MSTDSSDTEAHACQLPFDLDLLFLQHFPLALGINILLLGDIFLKILSLEMFFHFAQCLQIPSNIPSQVCFIRDRKDIESSHTTLKYDSNKDKGVLRETSPECQKFCAELK